ncbi:MAG TPA: DUF3880 domain-containing protein [Lachnospiraceae bacterium]|nr:DUF3880 domain-containing protein [Lachnospiraceae bacterium]
MNLLLYDACSYTQNDIMYTLSHMGISYKNILYKLSDLTQDDYFSYRFQNILLDGHYDSVFSINYYPIIAKICRNCHIKYISWSYDSPLNIPEMEETLSFSTNYAFFFDRAEKEAYERKGFQTVYHLPLAVNTERLSKMHASKKEMEQYSSDISFVGQLYDSSLPGLLAPLKDFDKGYLTAILEAQLHVYGYYFINDLLTDTLMAKINSRYREIGQTAISLSKEGLSNAIAKQITRMERITLLSTLGETYQTTLYSHKLDESLTHLHFGGSVQYYTQMPYVFRYSKVNLNPTLRSIQSGIPLRALDILGSGGFLLSNYQPELAEYFENEKEVVLYESLEDAVEKAGFYLEHNDLREKIAENGLQKVTESFTYEKRLSEIFRICQL